ncbi:hypothetical protein D3C59_29920 [Streptomyces sp. SHP22-7]|nr:hypothetical protein D3C59_29920 [Streptomyces sp. SHP22-7]
MTAPSLSTVNRSPSRDSRSSGPVWALGAVADKAGSALAACGSTVCRPLVETTPAWWWRYPALAVLAESM